MKGINGAHISPQPLTRQRNGPTFAAAYDSSFSNDHKSTTALALLSTGSCSSTDMDGKHRARIHRDLGVHFLRDTVDVYGTRGTTDILNARSSKGEPDSYA